MNLKEKKYFYFTQNSLTTFKNCPFKFKKKYIDNIKWQEEEDASLTKHINFGTDFHKIAERYFSDIPVFEESFSDDVELSKAFLNLKEYFPINSEFKYYPEYTIRYSDGDVRLEANIDLIIDKGDIAEIWDWKTNFNGNGEKYLDSYQTQIYMFVLKKCANKIFKKNFKDIKMMYFSPELKKEIVGITYSDEKYKKDEKSITNLIEKVYNFDWTSFDRSKFNKNCKFCEFNVFCNNYNVNEKYEFSAFDWDNIDEVF